MSHINEWKAKAKPEHKYMSVNNSSWHMSVFPEFHTNLEDIHHKQLHEKGEPMCYSNMSVVWDLKEDKPIFIWDDESHKLPPSTVEDKEIYWKEKNTYDERIRKEKEIVERDAIMAQAYDDRKTEKETAYNVYVKNCAALSVEPVAYFEFNK